MQQDNQDVSAKIGEDAGKIWKTLNGMGYPGGKPTWLSIAQLIRETKLSRREIDTAMGWLARENKIAFERDIRKRIVKVSLK